MREFFNEDPKGHMGEGERERERRVVGVCHRRAHLRNREPLAKRKRAGPHGLCPFSVGIVET